MRRDALAATVGPLEGKDGIGKRGQGSTRIDPHGLLGLQAQRLLRTGRNLAHDGQGTLDLWRGGLRGGVIGLLSRLLPLAAVLILILRAPDLQPALAADINGAYRITIDGRLGKAR